VRPEIDDGSKWRDMFIMEANGPAQKASNTDRALLKELRAKFNDAFSLGLFGGLFSLVFWGGLFVPLDQNVPRWVFGALAVPFTLSCLSGIRKARRLSALRQFEIQPCAQNLWAFVIIGPRSASLTPAACDSATIARTQD
jgi:hypothetical protein